MTETLDHEIDVLVVGAGPTGLTLACDLRRRGVAVRVIDRVTEFHTRSRGKGVQPRTMEVLADLGVAEQVLAAGWSRDVRLRWHVGGKLVADLVFPGRDPLPHTPFPNLVLLPQWRTEQILRDLLASLGGRVELGRELQSFQQDAHGVTATLRDAADGSTRTLRSRYVVGCDGAHSRVRQVLGLSMAGSTHDEHFIFGDVEIDGLDPEAAHAWFDGSSYFAASPFPDQRAWQVQATVDPDASGTVEPASLAHFARLLRERTGRSDVVLSNATWLSSFVSNVRMVDSYRKGRVLLAGDSAHVHSPAGGQGMNMGIQDAYNLGWKLALVLRGTAAEHLLDTYEEERLPIARSALKGTDVGHDLVFSSNPVVTVLRERLLVPLLRLPAVQRAVLRAGDQLDVTYRHRQLARDHHSPGRTDATTTPERVPRTTRIMDLVRVGRAPRAGDRAPDLVLTDPRTGATSRLFDHTKGPQFTLLVMVGHSSSLTDDDRLETVVTRFEQRLGEPLGVCFVTRHPDVTTHPRSDRPVLLDATGTAHRTYGAARTALYLIRPDGHVALRARPVDGRALQSYLDQVLLPAREAEGSWGIRSSATTPSAAPSRHAEASCG